MAHGSAHDRLRRTARLMLLLATLIGLAAMHTLGHHGPHLAGGHHGNHPAPMVQQPADAVSDLMLSATDGCDSCGPVLTAPMGDGHGLDGWDVCVAVLVTFATLLLAAVALRTRRTDAAAGPRRPFGRRGPRAPPDGRVGLTLATVSVLRT